MTSTAEELTVATDAAPAATIEEGWVRERYPLLVDGVIKHLMEEQQRTAIPTDTATATATATVAVAARKS